jgi:ATP-dependent helicase Lhr and Lhr-like helicase
MAKRSYCYRDLTKEDFLSVIEYLSSKHAGMVGKHICSKIWYDEKAGTITKRGRNVRMIYYTNTGMILDQFSCDVMTRDGRWIGNLDEKYMETLNKGDVLVIGGRSFAFCYRRGGNVYVDATEERPNIPSWISETLLLSFDLGKHVLQFKSEIIWRMNNRSRKEVIRWLLREYLIDENSAGPIYEIFDPQISLP